MKIGILTFHSQLNYGGVLQRWAFQQAMKWLENAIISEWGGGEKEVERRGGGGQWNFS